jgi:hypothetical protein
VTPSPFPARVLGGTDLRTRDLLSQVHSKIHKWREGKRRALEKKYEEDREGNLCPYRVDA